MMTTDPDRPNGQQETDVSEAPASERAPQSLAEGNPPKQTPDKSPQEKQERQESYWRRQAEKLDKELAAIRAERDAEVSKAARDRDEAAARATEAEWRAERLALFARSNLPSELLDLVPEGDPGAVAAYLEKLTPIAEKLSRPTPRGLTNTNPPNSAGSDDARLERLASQAARGDRRALREYSHLRERTKAKR
jgi:hypothetical protein